MKRRSGDSRIKSIHSGRPEDPVVTFHPSETFPNGKLPTKKDVIQRMLAQENFTTSEAARNTSIELIDHWKWCNVYTLSQQRV